MADLPESNEWTTGIYQLETSDPVLGGPEGIDNLQAKQLANRTRWLKDKIDTLGVSLAGKAGKATTLGGYGITDAFTKPEATSAIQQAIASLVASSPAALDTLKELADALGNDPNFATTMTNALAGKASKATTLGGYGITDAFTKPETSSAIQQAIASLVASSPAALDTLKELADSLGNDPNFATTMTNALAGKAAKATTLGGYGITDAATKTEVNSINDRVLSRYGGVASGSILLNNGSNDSPEIGWQTPGFDIRVDAVNKSLRFFAASDGETTFPLVMDVPNKSVSFFGKTAWHSGNLDPSTLQNRVGIQGAFKNLLGSASGTNATATYSADELIVESASNVYQTIRSVNVSVSLAASGANGLDAGTSSPSSWYSAWVIWNGTAIAGLFSLSATSPVMPAGYTHKARIGWVRSDASKNVVSFIQTGKSWRYKSFGSTTNVVAPTLAAGQAGDAGVPTWAAVSVSSAVPTTATQILVMANSLTVGGLLVVHSNQFGGNYSNRTNPPSISQSVSAASGGASAITALMTLESTNIHWANNTANAFLVCLGFEDNL